MGSFNWGQIAILAVQCFGVAIVLITVLRLRNLFGLGVFYVSLGLFKYIHYFLTLSLSAQLVGGLQVSIGSAVFFNGVLFAVLIIYILDGALQARRVIFALIVLNFVFVLAQLLVRLGFEGSGFISRINIPQSYFEFKPRIFLSGILLIFIDSFFIIYAYENVSSVSRNIYLRIFFTMLLVFVIHAVMFSTMAFGGTPRFYIVLKSGLISKIVPLIVYSFTMGLYISMFEKNKLNWQPQIKGILPVIKLLSHLEKYEELFTQKEKHKQAWQESELRFSSVIEKSLEGITIVDETGKVFVWNMAMEKITQVSAKEAIGENVWDVHFFFEQENITEDRKLQVEKTIEDLLKKGDAPFLNVPMEREYIRKDGSRIIFSSKMHTVKTNKGFILVSITNDVTKERNARVKLQQSETRFREIIELAVDGILLGDKDGIIIGANNKMLELSKRTKENLVGQNIIILFDQKELKEKKLRFDLLQKGETVIIERNIVQPGGKKVPIEMHTKMMPDGTYQSIFRDISERKKAIGEITNLNSRLLKAEEIAGLGFIEWDLETNRFFVSPEIKKIYEIPEHTENLRAFIEKNTHPDDKEFLSEQYKSAIEGKNRYQVDHRLLLPSGKLKWVSIHGEITNDEKGNAVLMVGTVLDVTRQKIAIEKLTESENKFRKAFTTSPDSININRLEDGLYIEVNNGFTELTGFTREETLGKTSAEIDIWANPDDRKKLVAELQQKGKAENMEFRFKMKDGSIKSTLMSANIITINQVPHILSITRDVTDRIQAKKELENFASRIGLLHTLDRKILAAHTTADVAYTALNELQKNIPFELASVVLYNPENNVAIPIAAVPDELKKEIINSELELDTYEIIDSERLKNNEVIIFNDLNKLETKSVRVKKMIKRGQNAVVMTPLIAENELVGIISLSAPTSGVFSNENINVIKEVASQIAVSIRQWKLRNEVEEHTQLLESRVAERTGQLEHSNRELRDFAQIVSHDLKAPLRSISQLSYWIANDYSDKIDKDGQEQLKMLIGRVQRLDKLIDGILQYSKVGKMREKEKHIDFNILVEDIISSLDIPKHITVTIENKLPEYNGDPVRFAQMFQNLIDNAIKYNDKQKGYVKIGSILKNNYWEFYVSDNGVGIEKNYFDRIFQIFQRLISRDEMEGTGIGLTLVKRIIQIYGGEIWLDSLVGEGTTFYFTLPLQQLTT